MNAHAQAPANFVLERLAPWDEADDVPTRMDGEHYFIRWSNISKFNSSKFAHSQSTLLPRPDGFPVPLPSLGHYSLEPISPGYRATEGFYALTSDFGLVASIEPTEMIDEDYAIKSLVFQTCSILNWPAGWSTEDYFFYNHADHFNENSAATGGMDDYNVNQNLIELAATILDDGGQYVGGPVLKYTTDEGLTGYRHASTYALLNNGLRLEDLGETGEWSGTYYSFSWQWDLTDIPGKIISVEISTPLIVHSSTIGVQIDVSDVYNDVLSTFPPPPPNLFTATPGDGMVLLNWNQRSGATGYEIKRSSADGGPYSVVGVVAGGSITSFVDDELTNGETYYYVLAATNDSGAGVESIQRSATPQAVADSQLGQWRMSYFGQTANDGISANDADPDNDGLANLLEYALRKDPLVEDSLAAVTMGQTETGTKRSTLTFNRRADPNLIYTVEASDDLDSWEAIFFSTGLADPDNDGYAEGTSGVSSIVGNDDDTYEAWDNVVSGARQRRFLRLQVSAAGN
ncbi:fibronectin type III domain-containing protein [Cerasicoccus frondis]|uniref:fibronectin type III domain-containing protein n=1 Tax=Cerasicoccus frondis TaxID=490090 RepID=UPI0028526239|nr:fibronectin type III domain-containing protein [Cerasicoccus frondis]